MNCRQGDLAIIVKSNYQEHIGKVVICLEWVEFSPGRWGWEIDLQIPGALHVVISDDNLRPVRDSGGLDEMLRIVGLPHREGVPA